MALLLLSMAQCADARELSKEPLNFGDEVPMVSAASSTIAAAEELPHASNSCPTTPTTMKALASRRNRVR